MADEQNPETAQDEPKKGKGILIVGLLVALCAGGAGFAVPLMAPQLFGADETNEDEAPSPLQPMNVAFVEFGEVVVNLNMDRFNRYLKLKVTLEVAEERLPELTKIVEERKAMLRGWLISHAADKTMDEIRGASGQNKLRREIHNHFNSILSRDGYDIVNDVYFEEFNVQ